MAKDTGDDVPGTNECDQPSRNKRNEFEDDNIIIDADGRSEGVGEDIAPNEEPDQNARTETTMSDYFSNSNEIDSVLHSNQLHNVIGTSVDQSVSETPKSRSRSTNAPPHVKDRLQRRLRFYFMSPIDKWKAKRRLPVKLFIQIFKLVLVTTQVILFGYDMSRYLQHQGNIAISFRQILFRDWDAVREVMTYPPSAGTYAVYTKDQFYDSVDYVVKQFANISDMTIGSFGYATNTSVKKMSALTVCKRFYSTALVDPSNFYYVFDNKVQKACIKIDNFYPPGDDAWNNFSSLHFFNQTNFTINFDRLLELELNLPLRDIYLNSLDQYAAPECYDVDVFITYDNTLHDGQVKVSLWSQPRLRTCKGNLSDNVDVSESVWRTTLRWSIVVCCILSFLLCARSLIRSQSLRFVTQTYFKKYHGKSLTFYEKMEFLDLWMIMIITNDIMIITGTLLKNYDKEGVENELYDYCSILLGVGNLFVWAGLLRYLEYWNKYNILILTVQRAIPNLLRFASCALLLYGGFCLAGWVILGPYHLKFRSISEASECLFSLINGDDMFATFYTVNYGDKMIIWWFSRVFLYLFISLFIYLVLSLFIAIIMDAYETVKDYYQNGWPFNDLQKFIAECPDDSSSHYYRQDPDDSIVTIMCHSFRRFFERLQNRYSTL